MKLAAGIAGALLLACGGEPQTTPFGVIGRMGKPELAAALPAPVQQLRLGSELRRAVCLPANTSFELPLDSRTRRVLFSVAVLDGGEARPVSFTVRAPGGGSAPPLFQTTRVPGEGWHDGRIDVPDGASPARLEFASRSAGAPPAEVCWGGVTLLGPRRIAEPNVVLVSLDTLGADYLGAFGGEADVSPALDAFLEEGFSFRRAYAQYPATLASHASLFSGQYPIHHGHYTTALGLHSLVRTFAARGYFSAAFTEDAYVGSSFGFASGFDRFDDGAPKVMLGLVGDAPGTFAKATHWLEQNAADTRFLLFVHTYEVHQPYVPHDPAARQLANRLTPGDERIFPADRSLLGINRHNSRGKPLDAATIRRLRALYLGEVQQLDRVLGRFLTRLAELGLEDDTLVVVTADHGELFGEHGVIGHGYTLHDRLLHVPLAFRWPGRIRPGESDALVELVDVMPTVLDLAGIAQPPDLDGQSLAPALRGDGGPPERAAAFGELRPLNGCGPNDQPCGVHHFGLRSGRYRYLRVLGANGPTRERLYDVEADPGEVRDVSAEHPDELARLRTLLDERLSAAVLPTGAAPTEADVDDATRERLQALGYVD